MKQTVVMLLAWAAGVGFSASASSSETVSNDVMGIVRSGAMGVAPVSTADAPPDSDGDGIPDKPEGEEDGEPADSDGDGIPDKPGDEQGGGEQGGGEQGGGGTSPGSGGSEDSVFLTGAYPYVSVTNTLFGQTLESTTSDQNVILAMTNAYVTVSNCVLNKSGDMSSEDNSNFYAVNAIVASKTASMVCIAHSTLTSEANGANGLFASGSGSTIYAYDCTITNKSNHSRGLDATYGGKVIASKMTVDTSGGHCAAFATDRGNGSISVTGASMTTRGEGSPLIYSTGAIEVNSVTGTSWGAQIAGIEGLSAIRIRNSVLSGSGEKASEPVANGVIIYQSNSGDSTDGTATFEVSDSTLTSEINEGAMFYITHSEAVITVQDTVLDFDTANNYLLKASGNDGTHGWGNAGSNGAEVVFTAIDQTLAGNVTVDGISSLDMYLVNSKYTGTFENDTTYTGDGEGIELFINSNSTWSVTADCELKSLTAAEGAKIVDGSGKTVSIYNSSSSETVVSGASDLTVTVSDYLTGTFATTNITAFEIDRTAFEAMYASAQGGEGTGGGDSGGTGGGVQDHNNWTNYFKPHPPDNAIVKVKVAGAADYGTPDRDHKYCLDGYWDGGEDGVEVRLLYVTKGGYLFADGGTSNVWVTTVTNNAQEVYPPEDVVAIRAQAKSGSTDYLTLKEAIESAKGGGKGGAKITLNDSVTLTETLTVTNTITLNLNTNAVTLGCALTPAFLITANATVSNGTINSSFAATTEDCTLLRFTNCKATLSDVKITGDGYLLYVDDDASVTLTNNCAFACNTSAAVYCSSDATLTIAGDTSKADGVVIAAPDGYLWEDGELVSGTLPGAVSAETATNSYETAQSATNAAIAINANKANCIDVPEGVEGTAKTTYLTKVEATVTSDNVVIIDLKPRFRNEEQSAIDAAVTNEAVVASLVSTNETATATLTKTTPGLYYWIEGGTDVGAVAQPGESVLSTDGGAIELSKPPLDATKGRAFFKIAAGLSAPAPSAGD